MSHPLHLFVFVDALGWQIAEWSRAFPELAALRRPLETQFGYSSACLPTILSGAPPQVHGHWNVFFRPPQRTSFARWRWLRHLPGEWRVPARLQPRVSRWLARRAGLRGYFSIHRLPLQRWHEFEVCEREDLFGPGALPRAGSVIDDARASGLAVHVSDWRAPEADRWEALRGALRGPRPLDWAFLYLAELDGVLHRRGWPDPQPRERISADGRRLRELMREAERCGYEVRVALFSDHGMANCREVIDLRARVARALPGQEGREYVAFYDSTMARFWSDEPGTLARLREVLAATAGVRVLDDATLRAWGAHFPGGEYGQVVALVRPGALIVPSDMGRRPLCGMHGYAPDDCDSQAALLANWIPDRAVERLQDLRGLMSAPLGACVA